MILRLRTEFHRVHSEGTTEGQPTSSKCFVVKRLTQVQEDVRRLYIKCGGDVRIGEAAGGEEASQFGFTKIGVCVR